MRSCVGSNNRQSQTVPESKMSLYQMGPGAKQMTIDLSPNYELFLNVILVLFLITSVVNIVVGLSRSEKIRRDTYGLIEVVSGLIGLIMIAWVMI